MNTIIRPKGQLDLLSQHESSLLERSNNNEVKELFRQCALAVLSCGSAHDDGLALLEQHKEFTICVERSSRGIALHLSNAPEEAFVDGELIRGIEEHLLAVLRDIVYIQHQVPIWERNGQDITDIVFNTLRNARALKPRKKPNLVVCWGGHAISNLEYEYTKEVGYYLGLRKIDICTGCGTGAMKGPMKGATIAHSKQRQAQGRYIGITEPGIIASEAPNAIVNELIIMPDIEKRLEAFVRLGHGIIVFPGGVGTCEEILYVLGILMHPDNQNISLPLILTGPKEAADYFAALDEFIKATLGAEAAELYQIIIDDPIAVAKSMQSGLVKVQKSRRKQEDAYHYNWLLTIDQDFQNPFEPTHENMSALNLHIDQPKEQLAANLRRAFSGIVAGNVKSQFVQQIEEKGLYQLHGNANIMKKLDILLNSFIEQNRMKISGDYSPCYSVIT